VLKPHEIVKVWTEESKICVDILDPSASIFNSCALSRLSLEEAKWLQERLSWAINKVEYGEE